MSQEGRLRVVTEPGGAFVGTRVGDFAISSSGAVHVGSLRDGAAAEAHLRLDGGGGVVVNAPLAALGGVRGDVATGSITAADAAAGVRVSSGAGAGAIWLDGVRVRGGDAACATLRAAASVAAPRVEAAAELALPAATLSCPAGETALRLAAGAPVLDVALAGGAAGGAAVRVAEVVAAGVSTRDGAPHS